MIESKFLAHPDKGEVSSLLLRPDNADHLMVLGHGAGTGMHHATMEQIAQRLGEQRIATFRYHFPYMERGGGRDSVAVSLATVEAAMHAAHEAAPDLPLLAGGHSFGGRMTSLVAAEGRLSLVKRLVFFGFPLHAPGKPSNHRAAHLPDIAQPMLFLTGTRDTLNNLELFQPIIDGLGDKATLHLLETANHGYKILKRTRVSQEDIFVEMARVVREWVDGML